MVKHVQAEYVHHGTGKDAQKIFGYNKYTLSSEFINPAVPVFSGRTVNALVPDHREPKHPLRINPVRLKNGLLYHDFKAVSGFSVDSKPTVGPNSRIVSEMAFRDD